MLPLICDQLPLYWMLGSESSMTVFTSSARKEGTAKRSHKTGQIFRYECKDNGKDIARTD